ncbi:MAG: hypothetical protein ABSH47_02600 [Bryobacteraceae bacterium]|jgi:hypothetical protein
MCKQNQWLKILWTVGLLVALWAPANAQTTSYVLPQLAYGGGWYSALYFTNQNDKAAASFAVYFVNDTGTPLSVPVAGVSVTSTVVNVPALGTAIIEAPNVSGLSQGYATFFLPSGVVGYGVFRQTVAGRPDQEAVVPFASTASTANTLVWDETSFVTAVSMVNPSPIDTVVTITVLDEQGNTLGTSLVPLPAYNKAVSTLRTFPGLGNIVGHRGSAQFTVSSGNVSVLGLRFGGSAFTSIPVTTDAPSADPPFDAMFINSQFLPNQTGAMELLNFTIIPTNGNTTFTATFPQGATLVNGTATTQDQQVTLTFNKLQATPNAWFAGSFAVLPVVSSASMILTVTQVSTDSATGVTVGNVSGFLNVTGTGVAGGQLTLAGPIFGTFVEPGLPK